MALDVLINTRSVDAEGIGKLLNVAEVTLANAASSNSHPVRKQEFDTAVSNLQAAINDATGASHAYVDTTNATLADALADASFAGGVWTFGATDLHVGDVLFLDAAAQQDSDRAWLMIAANGNSADFKAFGTDIDAAISAAVSAAVSGLAGDATIYTDLGLVEDKLQDLEIAVAAASKTVHYTSITWGAPDIDGVRTATVDTSADFGSHDVQVRVLKAKAGGYYEHLTSAALVVESNETSVRLRTDSGSIYGATLHVIVTGTPVVP